MGNGRWPTAGAGGLAVLGVGRTAGACGLAVLGVGRTAGACALAVLGFGLAPAAAWAGLPSITVHTATATLSNPAHTGVTITASCASGRLVSGGGLVRLIDPVNGGTSPGPGLPKVPTNGLVLGGTVPSTGTTPVDTQVADMTADPADWMTVANFTGVAEAGDQGSSFAMCAAGGPSDTVVRSASTTGANATQQVNPPVLTTATCPTGDQLVGGGAMTTTPDTVNNGTTAGNNGNLKPLASYPSDSSGALLAGGSTPTSWTAYGSSGIPASTDQVIAFAVCSTDPAGPPVEVARADTIGPLGQAGTTVLNAPVTCPTGTRLLGGGYRVDETVGATSGLEPQQGEHMRGSYPAAASGTYPDGSSVEAADGATNPTTWTSVGQLGGQNLPANSQFVQHGFALCAQNTAAPTVTTDGSSAVTASSADLAGTVTPNGLATTFVFEFGPSLSFGSITPATSAGSGESPVGLTGSLGGLQPGTTYFYRVVATNSLGTTFGPVLSFTTGGPAAAPDAVTQPASGVGNTTATLAGQVNPRGQATGFAFEYGTSTSFGTLTPTVELDSASSPEPVSAGVSGLAPDTTYFYRVVAVNGTGTTTGGVMSFTTGPTGAPLATTGAANTVSTTGATLTGTVNPRGVATAFAFEYGTTTSFGSLSAVDNATPTVGLQSVSLPVSGLAPNTTYRYRIVATNADGTATGAVGSFTTATAAG
jgi:hypothetical protein